MSTARFTESWRMEAKCLGDDIDEYDLDDLRAYRRDHDLPGSMDRGTIARSLCDGCPVARECANDALAEPPARGVVRAGVWVPANINRRDNPLLLAVRAGGHGALGGPQGAAHDRAPTRAHAGAVGDRG